MTTVSCSYVTGHKESMNLVLFCDLQKHSQYIYLRVAQFHEIIPGLL